MIHGTCRDCGGSVYRYSEDEPLPGTMGNADQDCWSVYNNHPSDHFPHWKDETTA